MAGGGVTGDASTGIHASAELQKGDD